MKSCVLKLIILVAFSLTTLTISAQTKSYISNKHTITSANGLPANVTNDKKLFFDITVWETSKPNDMGKIWITNAHLRNDYKNVTYQDEFRIYSIELKENGIYNYWTIDIATDGQIVLFQVDLNSAVPTITMFRYAPKKESTVLKTVIYYLE